MLSPARYTRVINVLLLISSTWREQTSRGQSIRWCGSRRRGRGCWECSRAPRLHRSPQTAPRLGRPKNALTGQTLPRRSSEGTCKVRSRDYLCLALSLKYLWLYYKENGVNRQRIKNRTSPQEKRGPLVRLLCPLI